MRWPVDVWCCVGDSIRSPAAAFPFVIQWRLAPQGSGVDDFTLRGSVALLRVGSNLVCVWVSWVSRQGVSCVRGSFRRQYKFRPDAHTAV